MQTQCFIIHIVVLVFIVSKLRLAHKSQIIAIPKSLAPFNSLVCFNPNSAGLLNVEKPSDKSVGTNRANQILTQTPLQILSHLFEKYLLQQQLTLALTYKLHTHTHLLRLWQMWHWLRDLKCSGLQTTNPSDFDSIGNIISKELKERLEPTVIWVMQLPTIIMV